MSINVGRAVLRDNEKRDVRVDPDFYETGTVLFYSFARHDGDDGLRVRIQILEGDFLPGKQGSKWRTLAEGISREDGDEPSVSGSVTVDVEPRPRRDGGNVRAVVDRPNMEEGRDSTYRLTLGRGKF